MIRSNSELIKPWLSPRSLTMARVPVRSARRDGLGPAVAPHRPVAAADGGDDAQRYPDAAAPAQRAVRGSHERAVHEPPRRAVEQHRRLPARAKERGVQGSQNREVGQQARRQVERRRAPLPGRNAWFRGGNGGPIGGLPRACALPRNVAVPRYCT